MFIKKMYVMLTILALGFLYINCGGNEKEEANKSQELKTETETEDAIKGDATEGQKYFAQTCSACHGMDAKGLPKLGKDLTTSKFVVEKTDPQMIEFLKQGRLATDPLNTTGVAMPPKGGNPAFNDQQLMDIVSYLREIHQ